MKTAKTRKPLARRGMTVIEISLTLSVMLMLASIVLFSSSGMNEWKRARNASLELRKVYIAQKSYLADHPTVATSTLTEAMLVPYLGPLTTTLPTFEGKDGEALTVKVDVLPPVALNGGAIYDPSGSSEDGLWDVGKK